MVEFFQNIWAWISSHAAQIAGVLTPANLILIIGNAVQTFRQKKAIAANTGSSRELKESLREIKELRDSVDKLSTSVAALDVRVQDLQDSAAQCITKLNCVLEVQQEAYSVSLTGTKTLDSINGIIANGKFAETHARKAITDEVAELRAQMEKLTAASVESEKKVKRMAGVAEAQAVAEAKAVRYD